MGCQIDYQLSWLLVARSLAVICLVLSWPILNLLLPFFLLHAELLQWGRPNLVEPAEWPKIRLLNQGFGSILYLFSSGKQQNTLSSLNLLQGRVPEIYSIQQCAN